MIPRPHVLLRPGRALATAAVLTLVLAGCSILGGPGDDHAFTRYDPVQHGTPDPSWPRVDWQLSLSDPEVNHAIDTLRIAVRPTPSEVQVYQGARWSRLPGSMVLDGVLQALEDSGRIDAVARQGSGIAADYRLVLEVRRFEAVYPPGEALPRAVVEVSAKLIHVRDQDVAAARTFEESRPAASPAVADVVAAFEQALDASSHAIAGWTLVDGDRHERAAH